MAVWGACRAIRGAFTPQVPPTALILRLPAAAAALAAPQPKVSRTPQGQPAGPVAEPVARIDVRLDPAPRPVPPEEPVAGTVKELLAGEPPSIREALEEAQRARAGHFTQVTHQAVLLWHDKVRPALVSRRARLALTTLTGVLMLALVVHWLRAPLDAAWAFLVQPLNERSYFLLEEQFQGAPQAWTRPELLAREPDGLAEVQEGLTLYGPSLARANYEFSFTGRVRRAALNWVVRASDANNYYAFKLTWSGRGRDRRSVLIRYAVMDGAGVPPDKRHVTALPFNLVDNRLYHVTVDVAGDRITTLVEDRGVDSFSDSRLKLGGVGFFAEAGESALIHSLSVSGNDDPAGRTIYWVKGFWWFLHSKL